MVVYCKKIFKEVCAICRLRKLAKELTSMFQLSTANMTAFITGHGQKLLMKQQVLIQAAVWALALVGIISGNCQIL